MRGNKGNRRGKASTTWSKQSRARFAKKLFLILPILREGYNYGITLTYRQRTVEDSKRDLSALKHRLKRKYKGWQWLAIWKMEFQLRGMVHYHIILHTTKYENLHELRQFISRAWAEITGDEQLAITGTRVDPIEIKRVEQAMVYILGHATSTRKALQNQAPEATQWTGRFWGIWNEPDLPATALEATFKQIHRLRRMLSKIRPLPNNWSGFWAYCEAQLFLSLISLIGLSMQDTYTRHRYTRRRPSSSKGIQTTPNLHLFQAQPP